MTVILNKSLQATRDGRSSSASRFTLVGSACLSSGYLAYERIYRNHNRKEAVMGSWGLRSFDNDDAMDWLHKLNRTGDFALVQETLNCIMEPPRGWCQFAVELRALAAAEIVASYLGHPPPGKEGLEEWVRQRTDWFTPEILTLARQVVASIKSKSELKENGSDNKASQAEWLDSVS